MRSLRGHGLRPAARFCLLSTLFLPLTLIGVVLPKDNTASSVATVTTRSASAVGTTGMTVNGSIHPHALPTTYYFEYGPTPAYGSKTSTFPLPPRLAAYYHESWDENAGTWAGGMKDQPLEHHPRGGASGGFVRFAEPSGDDHNHDDGIGTLHLAQYVYPGTFLEKLHRSLFLGGGDPDLRGAKVSLYVRGNNFEPHGAELVWWTQSQSNIDMVNSADRRYANWAYTGFPLTEFLRSGKWEKVEYRLLHDMDQWTYGGNNVAQQRPSYQYWPIDEAQAHVNADFFHLLAGVDVNTPPTGAIDFDEFELAYRNYSLLLPSNGGKLIHSPADSPDDPATLTDGWRHGQGRMWRSAAHPVGPLEFVYALQDPVTIHTVQLHQNPEWPAKEVEVLISMDNHLFFPLLKKVLPPKGTPNANFAFTVDRKMSARARYLKVRLLSGYQGQHWGLGEIEVFGTGALMHPDDDLYYVNIDLHQLQPGTTYHYRLVATNSAGTTPGQDQTFTVPADQKPHLVTGAASRIRATSARVEGRLNPLGLRTQFYFEYGLNTQYGSKSPLSDGGLQIVPRTAFATLTDLKPGCTYHYRLVGVNDAGNSYGQDATFQTPAP